MIVHDVSIRWSSCDRAHPASRGTFRAAEEPPNGAAKSFVPTAAMPLNCPVGLPVEMDAVEIPLADSATMSTARMP